MSFNLQTLLERAEVSINMGKLLITPNSGKQVPEEWIRKNENLIVDEIAKALGKPIYNYLSYSTGKYNIGRFEKLASGVCLQFVSNDGEEAFACINANLTRQRKSPNGNKGTPLPEGQFWVSKKMEFYKFWKRTGLKLPPRLCSFHEYMGKLKPILFFADLAPSSEPDKLKMANRTIRPVNLSHKDIRKIFLTYNNHTTHKQLTDKAPTNSTDKQYAQTNAVQGSELNSNTGDLNNGNKLISKAGERESSKPFHIAEKERVENQSKEEWGIEYDNTSPL